MAKRALSAKKIAWPTTSEKNRSLKFVVFKHCETYSLVIKPNSISYVQIKILDNLPNELKRNFDSVDQKIQKR